MVSSNSQLSTSEQPLNMSDIRILKHLLILNRYVTRKVCRKKSVLRICGDSDGQSIDSVLYQFSKLSSKRDINKLCFVIVAKIIIIKKRTRYIKYRNINLKLRIINSSNEFDDKKYKSFPNKLCIL